MSEETYRLGYNRTFVADLKTVDLGASLRSDVCACVRVRVGGRGGRGNRTSLEVRKPSYFSFCGEEAGELEVSTRGAPKARTPFLGFFPPPAVTHTAVIQHSCDAAI